MTIERTNTQLNDGIETWTPEEVAYAGMLQRKAIEHPRYFRSRQRWQGTRGSYMGLGLVVLLAAGVSVFTVLTNPHSDISRSMPDPNPNNVYQLANMKIGDEKLRWEEGLRNIPPPNLVSIKPFSFETSSPLDVRERPNFQSRVVGQLGKGRHKGYLFLTDAQNQWCGVRIISGSTLPDGLVPCNSVDGTTSLFLDPLTGQWGEFPPSLVNFPAPTS